MVEDDVMILDSGDEIYVWIGNDADENEKRESLKLAKVDIFWLWTTIVSPLFVYTMKQVILSSSFFLTIEICEFQNYIDSDPTERNSCNTLIFTVFQGEEPKSFTSDFPTWNVSMIYCIFAGFGTSDNSI